MELRTKARRLKAQYDIAAVFIDYLQLMQGSGRENRVQEVSEISRSLKGLARELDIPVIALSQLSRAVESRQPPRPQLSDLRESGSIEQDADVVMFVYREEAHNPNTPKKNVAEILIAKHRNGPTGDVPLRWFAAQTRFADLATRPPSGSD
jgi:replicative DNA helicase